MPKKKRVRRSYNSKQKAKVLRQHLLDKKPVSEVCEKNDLQPSVFYGWQRQLLDNAELALDANGRRKADNRERTLEREVEALRAKLAKKDNVIAEISEEYVALKKELGEL